MNGNKHEVYSGVALIKTGKYTTYLHTNVPSTELNRHADHLSAVKIHMRLQHSVHDEFEANWLNESESFILKPPFQNYQYILVLLLIISICPISMIVGLN